jgi:hypothetical protein
MGWPVLEASTPKLAPERPVSTEVKLAVLPVRDLEPEDPEADDLLEVGKVDVRRVTATRNRSRP